MLFVQSDSFLVTVTVTMLSVVHIRVTLRVTPSLSTSSPVTGTNSCTHTEREREKYHSVLYLEFCVHIYPVLNDAHLGYFSVLIGRFLP